MNNSNSNNNNDNNKDIGLMCRVFANGPGDWGSIPDQSQVQSQVKSKNGTWWHLA